MTYYLIRAKGEISEEYGKKLGSDVQELEKFFIIKAKSKKEAKRKVKEVLIDEYRYFKDIKELEIVREK